MTILDLQPDAAAGKDTYVHSGFPGDNFGTSTLMQTRANAGPVDTILGMLEFDLSSIPGGSTINSATLTLWNQVSASGQNFSYKRITAAWVETVVTWNTRPGVGTDYVATGTLTSIGPDDIDVSEFLKEIVEDGLTNFGFYMEAVQTNFFFQWSTSDHATAGQRPRLVVDYTEPEPDTIWAPANQALLLT